jgi:hypothetical protein
MGPIGRMGFDGSYNSHYSYYPHFLASMVGVTGFEPVTLRLSSACSNQLSYTPVGWLRIRRAPWPLRAFAAALRYLAPLSGGMGIRTPDL